MLVCVVSVDVGVRRRILVFILCMLVSVGVGVSWFLLVSLGVTRRWCLVEDVGVRWCALVCVGEVVLVLAVCWFVTSLLSSTIRKWLLW